MNLSIENGASPPQIFTTGQHKSWQKIQNAHDFSGMKKGQAALEFEEATGKVWPLEKPAGRKMICLDRLMFLSDYAGPFCTCLMG